MADTKQTPMTPPPAAEAAAADGRPDAAMALNGEVTTAPAGTPQQTPPEETAALGADEGITVWISNRKVMGLWTNSANKNSWINIQGLGWRKIYPGSETAVVSMTMMAAHARAENRNVNVRVDDDNAVHEIYVW